MSRKTKADYIAMYDKQCGENMVLIRDREALSERYNVIHIDHDALLKEHKTTTWQLKNVTFTLKHEKTAHAKTKDDLLSVYGSLMKYMQDSIDYSEEG